MRRILYSALLYLLLPLQFFRLWLRGRKAPAYRRRWGERLAYFPALEKKPRIWLHAVSVGETIAARPLVEKLLSEFPDHRVLVTSTTPTGSEQVKRLFGERVEHRYFPYDLPGTVRRFLRKTAPSLLVVMETELWPNCFHHCRRAGIPVIIANARLSPRSVDGYRRFGRFVRDILGDITMIAAQSEGDAERFIQLGASAGRIANCGNIKFDMPKDDAAVIAGKTLRRQIGEQRPVWIAASTHAGEEEIILDAHRRILETQPEALLILVPRHPERFDAVAATCEEHGFSLRRRGRSEKPDATTQIYLGDTMGELMQLYAAADIAFVGGSLNDTGGHNPLEPAATGLPVLTGPTIHNFRDIYELLIAEKIAEIVGDASELAAAVASALEKRKETRERGQNARTLIEENRGAVECITAIIRSARDKG